MRLRFRFQAAAGVLVCGIVASGCSSSATAPSPSGAAASPSLSGNDSELQQPNVSIEHLESQGWDCRPSPINPNRVTCSHPNGPHPGGLPGPPPPPDRPASISLLVFDNGVFIGTNLLIRSDLYHGQPCHSTGNPYRFIARIGYYECLHQSQGH